MAMQQKDLLLAFKHVDFTVSTTDGSKKRILQDVSGAAHSNRLLAIMGPSGAGKSTLVGVGAVVPHNCCEC
jgi:ABC-type multidrug transport system ATPase subunit